MNILTLLGSPRARGNTATILEKAESEFREQGHRVRRIHVARKMIGGCLGCGACRKVPDRIGCVQHDDAIETLECMIEADTIVFATPVYYWGMTAQLKALVDRTNALITRYGEPEQNSLVRGKGFALLATGGGIYENNELVFTAFRKTAKALQARLVGELHIGECREPGDMTAETKARGTEFARRVLEQALTAGA
ncbi:flavodoxin family protein [Pseudodesulfovibrio karagichevae]|uniref:Flavodoxin family protein n=1 Tax=Pseudodesulfovibrio karagichevae TaxID=3239305 RepID=A0ABV4K4M5_9BACT